MDVIALSPTSRPLSRKPLLYRRLKALRRRWRKNGERGATMLEWVLLLGAVAIPSYFIIQLGLATLFAHYELVTTLNGLPLP